MANNNHSKGGKGTYRPKPQGPNPQQRRDDRDNRGKEKDQHRINEQIDADKVRLTGDNVTPGIYSIEEALRIAERQEMDLVEIAAQANPPVCRVIDYQKFCYQQKKKAKEIKAKAAKIVVKEIRFGPQTDDHDFNFKLRHAMDFLADGAKVKAYVFFRGRSILFKEQGEAILNRFVEELVDYGKLEGKPVLEGKRMIIMLQPKPGAQKPKRTAEQAAEDAAMAAREAAELAEDEADE
jgi:translation initiation factor IF-3